jgi:hypothetical protein
MPSYSFDNEENSEWDSDSGWNHFDDKNDTRAAILESSAKSGASFRAVMSKMKAAGVGYSNTGISADYRIARAVSAAKSPAAELRAEGYFKTVVMKALKKGEQIQKGYERVAGIKKKSKDKLDEMERDTYDAALRYSLEESPKV